MGEARRRKLHSNGCQMELCYMNTTMKVAGMPEEVRLYIEDKLEEYKHRMGNKLEEYWALPVNTPALMQSLIRAKKREDREIILHGGGTLSTTLISEFENTIIKLEDYFTENAIPEIQQIVNSYNPQNEVLVVSVTPIHHDPYVNNISRKYKKFAVAMTHNLEYQNIYNQGLCK